MSPADLFSLGWEAKLAEAAEHWVIERSYSFYPFALICQIIESYQLVIDMANQANAIHRALEDVKKAINQMTGERQLLNFPLKEK